MVKAIPKPSEIANALGLYTADRMPKRGASGRFETIVKPHADLRQRWSAAKDLVFKIAQPAAMTVVVDERVSLTKWDEDGNVTRRLGHNAGMRCARFVKTSEWNDRAGQAYDKHAAYRSRAEFRLWCSSYDIRNRMLEAVLEMVVAKAERYAYERDLNPHYYDLGFDVDLKMFAYECRCIASDLQIRTRDDEELSLWLDQVLVKAAAKAREGRIEAASMGKKLGKKDDEITEAHIKAVLRNVY